MSIKEDMKKKVEAMRVQDDADVFCDTDQIDAILKDMSAIMEAITEWHRNVIYFCANGMHLTRLCAGYSVQLVIDILCRVLEDFKNVDIPLHLKPEYMEILKKIGEEK